MSYKQFRIKTPGGLSISVNQGGFGSTSCVFFHGLADGSHVWKDIRDAIGTRFRTIAIDLRGHGGSDWANGGQYNFQHYVSDIEFVLAALRLDKYILIGHSLGGSIIAHAWNRMPQGLRAIALVDVPMSSNPEMLAMLREQIRDNYREYSSVEEYCRLLREIQPLITIDTANHLARHSLTPTASGTWRLRFDVGVVDNDFDDLGEWWSQLVTCKLPVLLIRGAGSAVLSRSQAAKVSIQLPKITQKTVEMAGHAVMSDNPVGFCNALMPFLLVTGMRSS